MKYLAELQDGVVVNILVADDLASESETLVAYDEANPAYIGGDLYEGIFYPPRPFPSWIRGDGEWLPPVARPLEGRWSWDEDTLSWVEVTA